LSLVSASGRTSLTCLRFVVASITFFVVVAEGVVVSVGEEGFGVFVVVSPNSSSSFCFSCTWLLGVSPIGCPPKSKISSLSSLSRVFSYGIELWLLLSSLSSRAPSFSLSHVSSFPMDVAYYVLYSSSLLLLMFMVAT